MGLKNWLRGVFSGGISSKEMVGFLDVENRRVVRIPAAELPPGAIQVRLQHSEEIVWAMPDQLSAGPIRHPEFDEDVRNYIRRIQAVFAEHRPLSFEEWEEGFRRDMNPAQEIAIWVRAAEVYTTFAERDTDAARRQDIFRCVVACMSTTRDEVWRVLRPQTLSRVEAEQIVRQYFPDSDGPAT